MPMLMKTRKLCHLRDLYRALSSLENRFEKTYHLNLNTAMLLCSLTELDMQKASDLGRRLGLSDSNTSKIIAAVESQGLVERKRNAKDLRQNLFSITPEGRRRIAALKEEPLELPEIFFTPLPED